MKHKYILSLLIFFHLASLQAQEQNFISFANNILVLDNGFIHREIVFDSSSGNVYSSVLRFSDDDFNYMESGSRSHEFGFLLSGKSFNGNSIWAYSGFEKVADNNGGQGARLKFKASDEISGIEVHITYFIYPELPVISKQLTVVNQGTEDEMLEGIDVESLTMRTFPTSVELYTHYSRNKRIGPYVGNWEDPAIALHIPEFERGIILGNEAPGVLKRISFYQGNKDFCAGLTHPDQEYPFRKWLSPSESFTTPEVFLIVYKEANSPYEALNFTLPDYVRKHMGLEIFKNAYKPIFVYNTWNPFRKNIDYKMIGELAAAAEECGIQEFVIDDGWQLNKYTDKSADVPWWYTQVGDYLIDGDKFPEGLKPVFDDIKTHDMLPGLWLSIGSASISSEVYRTHPDWFSQDADEELTNLHTPSDTTLKTACMSTEWVDHIRNIILQLKEEYGLAYTKLDFASVTSAYVSDPKISGCYAKNHEGHRDHEESFLANYRGLFNLFDEIQKKAPDLFIDCTFETQGKLHLIDYAFMKHAEGNWLSNIEEHSPVGALRVRHLAWERIPLLPAASLVIGNLRLDSEDLEFDFFSLLGTFPIMLGDIRETSVEDRKWLKQWSDWMKSMDAKYNYMSFRQDLRGFGEPGEGRWDGWQRINTDSREGGIVGIFRQGSAERQRVITIEGLSPDRTYQIIDAATNKIIETYSGLDLAKTGFQIKMERNYQAKIFEVRGL